MCRRNGTSSGRRSQHMTIAGAAMVGILLMGHTVESQHVFSDSFPTNDEYDFTILDPHTVFGSPFGGFSRATRSRLAALPLHLPALPDLVPNTEDEHYYEVRDGQGRRFVCRLYHEDELEASRLDDSMFDTAIQRVSAPPDTINPEDNDIDRTNKVGKKATTVSTGAAQQEHASEKHVGNVIENRDGPDQAENSKTTDEGTEGRDAPTSDDRLATEIGKSSATENAQTPDEELADDLEHELSKLDGVCAQIHKGWWSYEWCHGDVVTQFHIHVDNPGQDSSTVLAVQDVTNVGEFESRTVEVLDDPSDKVDGMRKMGRVMDVFENGDVCPETGRPRLIQVELQCCSIKQMKQRKGGVLYKGKQVDSNIASILALKETETCTYRATVCTPVLCEGAADVFGDEHFGLDREKHVKLNERKTPPRKENESIRETLERTLNNVCLVSGTGGWWVYEFCHGRHVRQFHESTVTDAITGILSKVTETQYILGVYPASDLEGFPNEEEADHVVNATDGTNGNHAREKRRSSSTSGGNGSFFVQEYLNGDVCDDTDVTEAAIKAGNVGTGGIERSTTLRFSCGPTLELTRVNEDSTCHYVADVTIPDLCHHPLFKAPVQKKQVVKCLPVEDAH